MLKNTSNIQPVILDAPTGRQPFDRIRRLADTLESMRQADTEGYPVLVEESMIVFSRDLMMMIDVGCSLTCIVRYDTDVEDYQHIYALACDAWEKHTGARGTVRIVLANGITMIDKGTILL